MIRSKALLFAAIAVYFLFSGAAAEELHLPYRQPLLRDYHYQLNKEYMVPVMVKGGKRPYRFGVVSGSLPTGLVLTGDGNIEGTTAEDGNFLFKVRVRDATGARVLRKFGIYVESYEAHAQLVTTSEGCGIEAIVTHIGSKAPNVSLIFYGSTMAQQNGVVPIYSSNETFASGEQRTFFYQSAALNCSGSLLSFQISGVGYNGNF